MIITPILENFFYSQYIINYEAINSLYGPWPGYGKRP
jgi:hypothetical protein